MAKDTSNSSTTKHATSNISQDENEISDFMVIALFREALADMLAHDLASAVFLNEKTVTVIVVGSNIIPDVEVEDVKK